MAARKTIRKRKEYISQKSVLLISTSLVLTITLISSNIIASSKMYDLIKCNKQLSALEEERKELEEEKEILTSPAVIRDKAINNLNMVAVENIEELLVIQP